MIHNKIFAGLQKELESRYDLSSSIQHKGERGRSREFGVAEFLEENLPRAFGIATGELFSFSSHVISSQCDVIVYDQLYTPVFGRAGAVQQIPIEGVHAVIEVRSNIDVAAIKSTIAKAKVIRELWKSVKPPAFDGDWDDFCPGVFLFGFKLRTTTATCIRYLKSATEEEISITALDSGNSVWVGEEAKGAQIRPAWLDAAPPRLGMHAALAWFYFSVLDACQERRPQIEPESIIGRDYYE